MDVKNVFLAFIKDTLFVYLQRRVWIGYSFLVLEKILGSKNTVREEASMHQDKATRFQ